MYNNIFIRVTTFILTLKIARNLSPFPSSPDNQTLIPEMETFSLQPQTLITLADLVKQWNQGPISCHNSLVITGNHVAVTDGKDVLFSIQFSTEMKTRTKVTLQ